MIPVLSASVAGAEVVAEPLAPAIRFSLALAEERGVEVDAVVLSCQIRIEPARRPYSPEERSRLRDLFGEPSLWGRSLQSLLWTHVGVTVPRFRGSTTVDLTVPCSADLSLAATRYLAALGDGEVPLAFHFSGTVFYLDETGALVVAPIPWTTEARFTLPVGVLHQVAELGAPGRTWLALRRDLVDELIQLKAQRHLVSLDDVVAALLAETRQGAAS